MMSLAVISYDIVNDKSRNKVAKVLLDYGERVQYSVFEVSMAEKLPEITDRILPLIDKEEDNLRYYLLCHGCKNKKRVIGRKELLIQDDSDHLVL